MADEYTERKLKAQAAFEIGTAYQFVGKHKLFAGEVVTVVRFEKTKGGIVIEYKGTKAMVSPFSIAPVTSNGHRHPKAKIIEKIVSKDTTPVVAGRTSMTAPLREPAIPHPVSDLPKPQPINKSGLRAQAPTSAQCEALLDDWLHGYRFRSSRAMRQAISDRFDLVLWLRDRVPQRPPVEIYKQTLYYTAATMLQHPIRMPLPEEIFIRIAAKFTNVDRLAVNAHIEWMLKRLQADHATFLAKRGAETVEVANAPA